MGAFARQLDQLLTDLWPKHNRILPDGSRWVDWDAIHHEVLSRIEVTADPAWKAKDH